MIVDFQTIFVTLSEIVEPAQLQQVCSSCRRRCEQVNAVLAMRRLANAMGSVSDCCPAALYQENSAKQSHQSRHRRTGCLREQDCRAISSELQRQSLLACVQLTFPAAAKMQPRVLRPYSEYCSPSRTTQRHFDVSAATRKHGRTNEQFESVPLFYGSHPRPLTPPRHQAWTLLGCFAAALLPVCALQSVFATLLCVADIRF